MLVDATNVASLIEVGVGINLAVALLEGFRSRLNEYAGYIAKSSLNKKHLSESLNVLQLAEDVPTAKEAANEAEKFEKKIDELPVNVGFSDFTWDLLKLSSIVCGLFLFLNAVRFSFGGYKLTEWEVWGVSITCAFPFVVIFFAIIRSSCKAFALKREVKIFLANYHHLVKAFKELQNKVVPPKN